MKKWRYSSKSWKSINNDTLEFLFRQSETNLKETILISNQITSRAYQLLSVSITFITIAIGYLFQSNSKDLIQDDPCLVIAIISIIFLSVGIFYLFKIVFPRKVILSGSPPKLLMSEKNINRYNCENLQIKFFMLTECENYQYRIDFNSKVNEQRIEYLKKVMILIISIPILTFITLLCHYFC